MHYIESCMLCLTGEDDRATLVPDGFNLGAYRFDDMLDLHHITQVCPRRRRVFERRQKFYVVSDISSIGCPVQHSAVCERRDDAMPRLRDKCEDEERAVRCVLRL